jgi:hypothetical protein
MKLVLTVEEAEIISAYVTAKAQAGPRLVALADSADCDVEIIDGNGTVVQHSYLKGVRP